MGKAGNRQRGDASAEALEPVGVDYTIELAAKGGRFHASIDDLGVTFDGRSRAEAVSRIQALALAALARRITGGGMTVGPMTLAFSVSEREELE